MCTVTVVPHATGVRLLCNRDERRSRPAALPPRPYDLGGTQAIFPVDPQGEGTWIGCNGAGLAVALLNRNVPSRTGDDRLKRSRGLIVREVLRRTRLAAAVQNVLDLDPRSFAGFRIVIVQDRSVAIVASDGASIVRRPLRVLHTPLLLTSSSLGDRLVTPPRRRLFDRLVLRSGRRWLAGQARFHEHQWTARPEISVRMERVDALTVSRTVVDLINDRCELRYEAPVRPRHTGGVRCCLLR
jgi:hypothetical protein